MLFTDVQRSVRLNKKKKSTNTSPYPDEVIDRLARAFYPAILACWNSEEGQREFAAWQAEQAHHTANKEKQSVPDGERPVIHIAIVMWIFAGCVLFRWRTLFLFCLISPYSAVLFSLPTDCKRRPLTSDTQNANHALSMPMVRMRSHRQGTSTTSCRKAPPIILTTPLPRPEAK